MPATMHNALRCQVATTSDHIRDAMILRSICFVHEQGISPDFIFDGNETQATHFIFYDGSDPIGSLRIRWFANFAKYERTCNRQKYRHPFVGKRCIQMTFPHVSRKGYTRIMTQAEPRLAELWERLFKGEIAGRPVKIAGHPEPYVTVLGTVPADPDAITTGSDGAVLLRVEGEWDVPSAFEDLPR